MVGNDDFYHVIIPIDGYLDEYSSVLEFKEYLAPEYLSSEDFSYGWVFWAPERDHQSGRSIREKIRRVMNRLMSSSCSYTYMVQFWESIEVGGRSILTTSDQPFAVMNYLRKVESWYRKKCTGHHYIVDDGAEKDQLGPPGRVFRNGCPESSPDIRLYSVKEFPLRDHAANCGERSYLALPVFDLHHNQCVGVLEIVSDDYGADILTCGADICRELEIDNGRKLAVAEIKEMFELLGWSIQLQLASAWIPCSQCATANIGIFCMERVCDHGKDFFRNWKFQKVNIGKRLAGRVLESKNKMCYFENLGNFSILEYPWAHHAQGYRLEFCFVICLQSSHTANDLYVLEFFISPGSEKYGYPWSYLSFLLSTIKRNLKSFKVASGQQLGEHLLCQATGSSKEEHFRHEQNIIGTNSNKKNMTDEIKTSFYLSYEDLEPHFGKRLDDAANDLGVSRSTLKRAHKDCGLNRWPSNMNKDNSSLFLEKSSSKLARSYDQRIFEPNRTNLPISNLPSQPNVPLTCIHNTQEVDKTHQENSVMTIKAKFKQDIIKFDLCSSSGLEKLVEEVAKQLDLVIENFKLKYKDDDDDLILLTCNEDLHHCVNSMRSLGKRTMQVLVHLVSN